MRFGPEHFWNWVLNGSINSSILTNAYFGLDGAYRVTCLDTLFLLSGYKQQCLWLWVVPSPFTIFMKDANLPRDGDSKLHTHLVNCYSPMKKLKSLHCRSRWVNVIVYNVYFASRFVTSCSTEWPFLKHIKTKNPPFKVCVKVLQVCGCIVWPHRWWLL